MKSKTIIFLLGSLKTGGAERLATKVGANLMNKGYKVIFVLLKNEIKISLDHFKGEIIHLNTQNKKYRITKILTAITGLWMIYYKHRPKRIISISSGMNVLLFFTFLPNQVYRIDTNLLAVRSNLYRKKILKYIGYFPNIKKVVIPSNEQRLRLEGYVGKKSYKKFVSIPNPINPVKKKVFHPFCENIYKPYLVSVGRLNRTKGFGQLIKCFSKCNFNSEFNLFIIGEGPIKESLQDLILELKMENKIKLLGHQKYPEQYIENAEGLILNSYFEGFPNVLLEALSLSTPVLSHDCDFGPREIIDHGVNGLLYNNSKDLELINILELFINSKELRDKLRSNTSFQIERFNHEKITREWEKKIIM